MRPLHPIGLVISLLCAATASAHSIYLAQANHVDYNWNATAAQYDAAMLSELDYYLANEFSDLSGITSRDALADRLLKMRVLQTVALELIELLDEIGKELPITIGVTVVEGAIDNVRILEFRESRGWEVRYPFFTDQYVDARLEADGRLDRRIDGITGATLSVGAVTRIARVALLLDDNIKTTS